MPLLSHSSIIACFAKIAIEADLMADDGADAGFISAYHLEIIQQNPGQNANRVPQST